MHKYFIKTPWLAKKIFSSYVWSIPADEKIVYLTFDDGPHPVITPWVLDLLNEYNAKASFFCIGNNVVNHPAVFRRIQDEGHATGNHTYHHLNGWKTSDEMYLQDVRAAASVIESHLFRPPYGRIKNSQAKHISAALEKAETKIVMWDVLSADFDSSITAEECLQNVIQNVSPGSIIVFHDSEKAFKNLQAVLPPTLEYLQKLGWQCERISI